jgi:hypothetical protein
VLKTTSSVRRAPRPQTAKQTAPKKPQALIGGQSIGPVAKRPGPKQATAKRPQTAKVAARPLVVGARNVAPIIKQDSSKIPKKSPLLQYKLPEGPSQGPIRGKFA